MSRPTSAPAALPEGRVRTPTLLQMEVAECGAACLGIILGHHRRFVPLAELRRACGVSRDGSRASNVLRAARAYGLVAKGFKKEIHELAELPYPFIVFWSFNHFVVVEGARRGRVFLNDPATGPRSVTLDEFDAAFTGVALSMTPGPAFARGGRPASVVRGLWKRLRPSAAALLLCGVLSFLMVLPGLAMPAVLLVFIDDVLGQGHADRLGPLIAVLAAATLIGAGLTAIQLRLLRRLKSKLAVTTASQFVWHLLRLPSEFYVHRHNGEIAGRVALNERTADLLSGRLASAAIDVCAMAWYAAAMLYLDWVLALVAIAFAGLHAAALRSMTRRRVDATRRFSQEHGSLIGAAIAGLQGMRTIKASGLEQDFFARLAGRYARAVNTHQGLAMTTLYGSLLPPFVSSLMALTVLVVGGLRVMDGALTIGVLVAIHTVARSFLLPVSSLLNLGSAIQDLQGAIARLDDVLQNPVRTTEGPVQPRDGERMRLRGDVELRDVQFGYNRVEPPLIDGLSLTIRPGQRVALVGASGSGKSTIARLVAGLMPVTGGEILFDGRPHREVARAVMTGSLAMVDQDVTMFAATVRENLTLWDPTIPEEDIVRACRDAVIHDDILALPQGYDTPLLEGAADLSGGQRQRLDIARALCGDPAILVLDEATSALDADTERRIDQHLRRRGCSCLIVAHRLSTIRDADDIIVLERGKVVQRGTHEQMMADEGPYRRLLAHSGLALTGDESLDQPLDAIDARRTVRSGDPSIDGASRPDEGLTARRDADRERRFHERQALNAQVTTAALASLVTTAAGFEPIGLSRAAMTIERDGVAGMADAPASALPTMGGAPAMDVTTGVDVGTHVGVDIDEACQRVIAMETTAPLGRLSAIVDATGVRPRRVRLTGRWWTRVYAPLFTQGADGHDAAIVLPRRGWLRRSTPRLVRPGGPALDVDADVAATVGPIAHELHAPLPERSTARRMLRQALRPAAREIPTILFASLAVTLLGMLTPQAALVLFDEAVPNGDRWLLFQVAVGLLAAGCGAVLFDLVQAIGILRVTTAAAATLQIGVWDRLLRQPAAFFRRFTVGDLRSRADAVTQIRLLLNETAIAAVLGSLFSLLNLALLFHYSPRLAWAAALIATIAAFVSATCGHFLLKMARPLQEVDGQLTGVTVQVLGAVAKLQTAGAEARAFAWWARLYARRTYLSQAVQVLTDRFRVVGVLLWPVAIALFVWLALGPGPRVSMGEFVAFNAAFGTFFAAAVAIGESTGSLLLLSALWQRMDPILDSAPETDRDKVDPGSLTGRIQLEQVTFRYRDSGRLTLDDVSIRAEPGECIALVGPSGSGKSTIVNLLLRFEVPARGSVSYDGRDLRTLRALALRKQIGVVTQENRVLAGSIYDNIVCGSLLSMDAAWEAAAAAGLADEIRAMPMGMHTLVSESGSNLSGGQRQRLLIARALVQKPRILILDEATSALDNRTQAIVTDSLNRLQATRIVVAHRLSTVRQADRIYVIEAGRVVQAGTFDALMQQDGMFARLMRRQTV